ncbi:MAG: glycosyltransferase family 4 protein [Anaerolineae bacterium]|nr:glycosyltransferase family 4 protein [Anaerolineae bacterium]
MRICYVLLSPTFGMHQYTADLANRMVQAGHDVHLVTTTRYPRDRYAPTVAIHTPLTTTNTGFSTESLHLRDLGKTRREILGLRPDLVHFSGPHLWNHHLVQVLAGRGIRVIHTLHDLDPHHGTRYGALLKIWNRLIIRSAHHILVHGQTYRDRLIASGISPERVTYTPLLHLFLGNTQTPPSSASLDSVEYQRWALFFGRLERYKGVEYLLTACEMLNGGSTLPALVMAGPGNLADFWAGPLPERLELHNRLINDAEAIDLFRRCGLVVLPYIDATQSALVAAAYYFRKPVIVTRTGALPEYVQDGETGYIIEPGHPAALARRLDDMLSDPERLAQMGMAGRAWYDARRNEETEALFRMYQTVRRQTPSNKPVGRPYPQRL